MRRNYLSIQALRGVWALLVVVFHAVVMVRDRLGVEVGTFGGAAGVDLFFAISGFTLIITTQEKWGKAQVAWAFLKRRLIRIIPLYWLVTTVKLVLMVAAGEALVTSWHTIASYLFIPAWNSHHQVFPLLIPGWTLSFEMFFYLLMAGVLFLKKQPLVPLTIIFVVLGTVGFFLKPFEYAALSVVDPQLMEFVFGMWIAKWTLAQHTLPKRLAWGIIMACLLVIAITNAMPLAVTNQYHYRFLIWGVPSALLLLSALAVDDAPIWKFKWFQELGNASYVIYLTHDFAISVVRVVMQHLPIGGAAVIVVSVILSMILSAIGGIFVHKLVEKPMTRWFRNRFEKPARTV